MPQITDNPTLGPRFRDALALAFDVHRTQERKGGQIPYISHVMAVACIVLEHGSGEDEAIAALLHDAIEDAPPPLDADWMRRSIRFRFGEPVLNIVEACTDADVPDKPAWRPRKETYINHLLTASASVVLVSASDKLHNASRILSDYREIKDKLWDRFNPDAKKIGTIGYYRGLVTAYKVTGHHPTLVAKLDAVVTQIEKEAEHTGVWPLPQEG